jgi:hypothetical protein
MRAGSQVLPAPIVLGVLVALGAAGCNQDPGEGNGDDAYKPAPCPDCIITSAYPPGPYAVNQGSVIYPFTFQGFVDAAAQGGALGTVSLSDFYNPHAGDASYQPEDPASDDRLFPEGSPYGAGTKKPRVLLIDIASVWCGPCNEEAKNLLNGLYAKYHPCGGQFVFQLAEGAAPGVPVDQKILHAWVTAYHVTYPATIDVARQLLPLYNSDSFPDSAIIDTRTMKIINVIAGVPDATFWSTYESLLEPGCLAH